MPELSNKEIEALLLKIRNEYKTYAQENPNIFKLAPFEERYTQILRSRGSLELFFKDELLFLEQLKAKHKELKARREASQAPTIGRIMEENETRILKYNKIDFHPMAKNELKYFYGAISNFVETDLQLLYQIFRGTAEINSIHDSIIQLERIGLNRKGQLPFRISEHMKILTSVSVNQGKIEQDSQSIMKDGCLALKHISMYLEDAEKNKKINMKLIFKFNEKDYPELFKKYNGISFDTGAEMIIVNCANIITDFRMDSIVGLKPR
ncbi:MAG TPA: hypothetical protein PK079_08190 [Leptospiraceae bacterium]|nr:hypothetical protein [Leptospiraceae bacterium]HMW06306.1 hypothetical protein [Leptospiraceae bacterium]HMX31015.1 hypothetical protein [Leptospiraceae bacterium]HMY32166.1 hypothetical protein [Leptospiraceae bacterium]HMZ65105.1 hypothetical protein [Leptospiraceae bacterium]